MSIDPSLQHKIRRQVVFYFSDSNLPYDKFLWTLTKKNPEGWVPIDTIASFKKMKMLTESKDTVVEALKAEPLECLEIDQDNANIRRTTPLVEQNHFERSVYSKGFPLVDQEPNGTLEDLLKLQDEIHDFFEEHGKVLAVRLRKTNEGKDSKFKGSVFVEFATPEEAEKVVQLELEFKGNKLTVMTRKAYSEMKSKQYEGKPKPPSDKKKNNFNAFRFEKQHRDREQQRQQQRSDRRQPPKKKANYRLMTFKDAGAMDEEAIKNLVGSDSVASVTKKEDGTGFVLLSNSTATKTISALNQLEDKISFSAADIDATEEFNNLTKTDGLKRKRDDQEDEA